MDESTNGAGGETAGAARIARVGAARIALVTDSTCDMPEAERLSYGTIVVPLHVSLGSTSYLDRVELDPAGFYQRFRDAGQIATSSQPSVGEFVNVYTALLESHDSVLSVHISGRLSGTVQSASVAAEAVDPNKVRLVDSRQVSVGLGLVVRAAGEAIAAGGTLEAVVAATEAAAHGTRVYGAPPSLEVAVRGGRVSARVARLAGLIDLKPIIVFDDEGAAHADGGRLGFYRTLRGVVDRVARFASGSPVRVVVVHADGLEAARYVVQRLHSVLETPDIPIVEAGAVITTHVGLGTVAVGVQRIEGPPPGDSE